MDLDKRVTREEAYNTLMDIVETETYFTEQNDPDHDYGNEGTLGDYFADVSRVLARIQGEED